MRNQDPFWDSMYDKGEGVPEDDRKAVKWFRLAAEQRHAEAVMEALKGL